VAVPAIGLCLLVHEGLDGPSFLAGELMPPRVPSSFERPESRGLADDTHPTAAQAEEFSQQQKQFGIGATDDGRPAAMQEMSSQMLKPTGARWESRADTPVPDSSSSSWTRRSDDTHDSPEPSRKRSYWDTVMERSAEPPPSGSQSSSDEFLRLGSLAIKATDVVQKIALRQMARLDNPRELLNDRSRDSELQLTPQQAATLNQVRNFLKERLISSEDRQLLNLATEQPSTLTPEVKSDYMSILRTLASQTGGLKNAVDTRVALKPRQKDALSFLERHVLELPLRSKFAAWQAKMTGLQAPAYARDVVSKALEQDLHDGRIDQVFYDQNIARLRDAIQADEGAAKPAHVAERTLWQARQEAIDERKPYFDKMIDVVRSARMDSQRATSP
jgi:hypothetical protein